MGASSGDASNSLIQIQINMAYRGPQGNGPSCLSQIGNGLMLGCTIGGTFGLIVGTIGGLSAKLRGRQLVRTVGNTILQSGGAFGFFLAIGSAIRCDYRPSEQLMISSPAPITSTQRSN